MIKFVPPRLADGCQCRGNPIRAMFCQTGHMTECHYPLDCRLAGCGHLERYGFTAAQVAEQQEALRQALLALADPECERCGGQGVAQVSHTVAELVGEGAPNARELLTWEVICPCVQPRLVEIA